MRRHCRILFAILALAPLRLPGDEGLFSSVIEPVFKRDCSGCHGDGQTLGNLDLRTRQGLLKGGTRGPAIVVGNARASILYQALEGKGSLQMPPGGPQKKLPTEVIAAVREWIDGGAPWPSAAVRQEWSYKDEDLWAFKPVAPRDNTKNIDAFLDGKLRERGLKPASRADRRTLIRRATLDLTGLPPAPEEVDAFVNDRSKDAWPRMIDRLLASPRYGERWARHWLDVVRYADSSGYSNDFERPNAWRYRDYVIRSFQDDKPYDRFIREQIAGDELNPGDPESLIATGFLRAGPWEHTGMSVEAVTRQMFLDDVTHGVASTFLGVTLGCARCHDHKFDPISTRDYYRTQAVFATTEFARPTVPFLPSENTADLESGRAHLQQVVRRTQAAIEALTTKARRSALEKYGVERVEDLPAEVRQQIANVSKSSPLTEEEQEEAKLYRKHLQLYRESLDRYQPKAFAVSSGPLDGATDGGPNLRYPPRAKYAAPAVHILPGGNLQSPAEPVDPGVLGIVARYSKLADPKIPSTVAGRRTALANWIAHPDNPLTARVMVNRIWQYHFGQGIAADTSNLGKMGRKPSHPELLDWLAAYFVEQGWSVKAVHRAILLSNAYQRASTHPDIETVRAKDPGNTLLAYFAARRVEAEVLRDSLLAVSGELSTDAGGPGVFPQINEEVARQPRHAMGSVQPAYLPSPLKRQRNRRTVYTFQQRSLLDPMIEVFNGPSLDLSCERRESSTVPTQAFTLLNGQFVHDMALEFARRIEREAPTAEKRIERAFRLAHGRPPDAREARLSREHIRKMTAHHRNTLPPPRAEVKPVIHTITSELTGQRFQFVQQPGIGAYEHNTHPSEVPPEIHALADLALVLLNSNEFVYVD